MRTKLKDVVNGYVLERRFNIGEKLEDVRDGTSSTPIFVYGRCRLYFYESGNIRPNSIAHDLINGVDFLLEGMVVDVVSDASQKQYCLLMFR